jgi:hypothetical protein
MGTEPRAKGDDELRLHERPPLGRQICTDTKLYQIGVKSLYPEPRMMVGTATVGKRTVTLGEMAAKRDQRGRREQRQRCSLPLHILSQMRGNAEIANHIAVAVSFVGQGAGKAINVRATETEA